MVISCTSSMMKEAVVEIEPQSSMVQGLIVLHGSQMHISLRDFFYILADYRYTYAHELWCNTQQ